MIISEHAQRSPEWVRERLSLPTASNFHRLISPVKMVPCINPNTGKMTEAAARYARELCVEHLFGVPCDPEASQWMARGTALEDQARAWYEFQFGGAVTPCGLCLLDDRRAGASPDALVDDDGLLEIKIVSAQEHIGFLLDGLDAEYRCQLAGQLWVCGRRWVDFVSWNPDIQPYRQRVERDAELAFIAALGASVLAFADRLESMKAALLAKGCKPRIVQGQPSDGAVAAGALAMGLCKVRREDGRWCLAPGIARVDGEPRCAVHAIGNAELPDSSRLQTLTDSEAVAVSCRSDVDNSESEAARNALLDQLFGED